MPLTICALSCICPSRHPSISPFYFLMFFKVADISTFSLKYFCIHIINYSQILVCNVFFGVKFYITPPAKFPDAPFHVPTHPLWTHSKPAFALTPPMKLLTGVTHDLLLLNLKVSSLTLPDLAYQKHITEWSFPLPSNTFLVLGHNTS